MSRRNSRPAHIRQRRDVATALSWLLPTVAGVFIGLVIEHVVTSQTTNWRLLWVFFIGAAICLLLFGFTRVWARRLDDAAGTLYYVRLLAPWMNDWHDESKGKAKDQFLRFQPIQHAVDLTLVDGIIDARDAVAFAEEKLGERFAVDDPATGFTIAPDVLVPLGYALGYRMSLPTGSRLLDFGPPEFEWRLTEPGQGFTPVSPLEHEIGGRSGIHVHAALTGDPTFTPLPYAVAKRVEVGVVEDGHLVEVTVGMERDRRRVHPAAGALAWNSAMRAALHTSNGMPVVITARVPKTLGVAAGHLLAPAHRPAALPRSHDPGCGHEGCVNDACLRPWRYLLPLNYNQRADAWEPIWLLAEQRDPRELIALLEDTP